MRIVFLVSLFSIFALQTLIGQQSGVPTITAPYYNLLNNPDSVAQDFNDYSQAISEMMHYESGNYSISSNRLEFTTASSWLGVKTLKTQLGFSSGWSAEVDFHLSPLNNVINGHWYDTGISLSMGNDLFSAFPNRINLKAVQAGEGRKIAASFYSDNTKRRGLENTTALATATDGTLRVVYNPSGKTINCLFRLSGDTAFTSLGIIDLEQSPGWSVSPTSVFNISLFAGSVPFQAVPSFPAIQSGDMYLTNFKVIPGDWLYTITNNQATITEYVGSGGVATIPSQIDGAPVTKIGNGELPVFGKYNSSVTSVTIPNSVTSIGDYAFQFFSGLTSVTIPNSVTSIGAQAFQACRALTSITIPNSVTSIGESAFNSCSSLANLIIGNSVTSIRPLTFWGCVSLTTLAIGDSVTSIEGGAFSYCAALTSLNIPNSVTSIGSSAFQYCDGLTTLTIPTSLNSIGGVAFQNCTNLTRVLFLGDAPVANNSSFGAPTTVYYLCGASGWGSTFAGRPTQEVTAKDIIQTPDIVGLYSNGQYSARYEAGQQSILSSPNSYSLYTASQMQTLAFGDLVLIKNSNGSFTLNYDIEQSTDLQNWTTYAPLSTPLTGLPPDKAFVRIKAKQ